jgi:hypothetical protein
MPLIEILSAACLFGVPGASDEPPARPKYARQRFDEDWSVLRGQKPTDFFDPIKYIPLNEPGSVWLSLGGELRERFEGWTNFNLMDADDTDGAFLLSRFKLHADAHVGENYRVFVEGLGAFSTDRDLPGGRRTGDINELDLLAAFGEAKFDLGSGTSLRVRLGRQPVGYGKSRVVSASNWENNPRTYDGVTATVKSGVWTVDGVWTRIANQQKYEFDDGDSGRELFGLHAARKTELFGAPGEVNAYWFALNRDSSTFNGESGREERHTFGARAAGKVAETGLDFDVEAALQYGQVGDAEVEAWMLGSQIGYTAGKAPWKPRVYAGLDIGSGDARPGDGEVETYNRIFGSGHNFYGYLDYLGRSNAMDISFGASASPVKDVQITLDLHFFRRLEAGDDVYTTGSSRFVSGMLSDSLDLGREIDLGVTWQVSPRLGLAAGAGRFFPGSFFDEAGRGDTSDWVFVEATLRF